MIEEIKAGFNVEPLGFDMEGNPFYIGSKLKLSYGIPSAIAVFDVGIGVGEFNGKIILTTKDAQPNIISLDEYIASGNMNSTIVLEVDHG